LTPPAWRCWGEQGPAQEAREVHREARPAAPLASDAEEGGLSDALGIWTEKSMYGRTYMGMERTTYLVGADGGSRGSGTR
jgi:peroxiredoxin Q/BCP